jgi:PKD repeat protein
MGYNMKVTGIIIIIMLALLMVCPASAWIAGYSGRQAVNVIGDGTWAGNATDYPIVINVTNANGVSSGNKIYLNGTGAAFTSVGGLGMINDLRFTDTSDNLYPYWIEHSASNSSYWKCWVNMSTIYKNSTSLIYIYYGNSAATFASSANTTFVIGDDFTNTTVDTTIWNYNATQVTPTISIGVVGISSPTLYGLYSKNLVQNGYETRIYASKTITTSATWLALVNGSVIGQPTGQYSAWQWRTASAASSPVSASTGVGEQNVQFATSGYHVYNIFKKIGAGTVSYIDDGSYKLKSGPDVWYFDNSNDAYNQSVWLGGDSTSTGDRMFVDWVMVRPNWTPAPVVSLGNAGPTVWFIANRTTASSPADIQFTDQSYGYPTAWQWDFGDGTTPAYMFNQSPIHTYQVDGTYNVSLTGGNINGTNTATRYNYITISKTNLTPGYGTYYNPKTTTFHVQTAFGAPIVGATVTAQGVNTTMGDWTWLYQILGINQETTPIGNSLMNGTTDTNGDVQFMMVPTGYFEVSVFKAGVIDRNITVTPTDDKYVIMGDWNLWGTTGKDPTSVNTFNVTTVSANATHKWINITGNDTLNHFTGGTVYLNQTNMTSGNLTIENVLQTYIIPASNFTTSFLVSNYTGQSYFVRVNALQSDFGTVKYDFGVTFPLAKVNPMGLDNKMLMLMSIVILLGTGAIFTATTAHNGPLLVCFVGWILYAIGWMDYGGLAVVTGLTLATILSIAIVVVVGRSKS